MSASILADFTRQTGGRLFGAQLKVVDWPRSGPPPRPPARRCLHSISHFESICRQQCPLLHLAATIIRSLGRTHDLWQRAEWIQTQRRREWSVRPACDCCMTRPLCALPFLKRLLVLKYPRTCSHALLFTLPPAFSTPQPVSVGRIQAKAPPDALQGIQAPFMRGRARRGPFHTFTQLDHPTVRKSDHILCKPAFLFV